mmetsp:Transcript_16900/g.26184  ORF Transcript_16900/g.26184 Transcript_16900/m.26184 type:complete len:360 (+) Transcript_16900:54-1133(+)
MMTTAGGGAAGPQRVAPSAPRLLRKIKLLHSHHDPYFLHKGLGLMALIHFLYRFVNLVSKGSMGFRIGDPWTLCSILLHVALSYSALIFKTPIKRTTSQPMMWKEFQLHSITFASRSLGVMLVIFFGQQHFRGVVVLTAHLVADEITRRYKQGTTMRDMPFPASISDDMKSKINLFYAISQIFAVVGVLLLGFDEVFLILFPIQFAAFLLTLVRKNIISAGAWHFIYAFSLGLPYLYLLFVLTIPRVAELLAIGLVVGFLRFRFRVNKYLLWCPVALSFLLEGVALGPKIDPKTGNMITRWTELQVDKQVGSPSALPGWAAAPSLANTSWKLPTWISPESGKDGKTEAALADDTLWLSP